MASNRKSVWNSSDCSRSKFGPAGRIRNAKNHSKLQFLDSSYTPSSGARVRVVVLLLFDCLSLHFLVETDTFVIFRACTHSHFQCKRVSQNTHALDNRIHLLKQQRTAFFLVWSASETALQGFFWLKPMDSLYSPDLVQNWSRFGLELV